MIVDTDSTRWNDMSRKGMKMDNEELTEIKEDICDNYCKYPIEIADDSVLRVICNKCPLNRLEGDE